MHVAKRALRVASGLLSAGCALLTLTLPILGVMSLYDENGLSFPHENHWLFSLAGYCLTILGFCVPSAILVLAFFRYSRYGALRRPKANLKAVMIDQEAKEGPSQ